jgi:hypothetical protein
MSKKVHSYIENLPKPFGVPVTYPEKIRERRFVAVVTGNLLWDSIPS